MFDSEKSCLDAVTEMDGFEMYGKAMRVSKAKTHSDKTVETKASEMFDEHKRKRLMLKGKLRLGFGASLQVLTGIYRPQACRGGGEGQAEPGSCPQAAVHQAAHPRRIRAAAQDPLHSAYP